MLKRISLTLAMLLSLLPLAGCWDRTELEQRGFVTGIAIDEGGDRDDKANHGGRLPLRVTFQEVIPAGLKQTGQSDGSLAGDTYFNLTLEGSSILSIITKLSAMTSRTPFFEHLKIVVISEKVARTEFGFANMLDFFLRNNDARRNVAVMIAKGEAKKVLDTLPQGEKTPVIFIQSISKNQESFRMVPETRIGDIHENLLKKQSFTVQVATEKSRFISLDGAAVMTAVQNKLAGFLDDAETKGYNFIRKGILSGVIEVSVGDSLIVYKIEKIKRRIKVDKRDPAHIRFTIEIDVEGDILEAYERLNYLDDATLQQLQEHLRKAILQLTGKTIKKSQKVFKKDILGLGSHLEEWHPKLWKSLKDEWDTGVNHYAKSDIEVIVRPHIRRIGSINNSEQR